MRTNVNLDTDAYNFASAFAAANGITLGAAISELLRRAEHVPEASSPDSPRLASNEHGYLEIAATGSRITPEMVKEAAEDEIV